MQVSPVGQLPDGGAWTYEAKLCLAAQRSNRSCALVPARAPSRSGELDAE